MHREFVTGAVPMSFMGRPFTNAYRNLTNIVVTITPRGMEGRRALLIAAHQDTAVSSPGEAPRRKRCCMRCRAELEATQRQWQHCTSIGANGLYHGNACLLLADTLWQRGACVWGGGWHV